MTSVHHSLPAQPHTATVSIDAWKGSRDTARTDEVVVEEPLEIRLAGCSVAVTMRTPGNDFDLATGFLFTEGIISDRDEIASIAYCPSDEGPDGQHGNIVNVNPVNPSVVQPERWTRNFFATSSCGLCGKASIASVRQDALPIDSPIRLTPRVLYCLDDSLRQGQAVFSKTGGLHAAALFDTQGSMLVMREDIGRHNAVDKVIGHAFSEGWVPLRDRILMVSSRGSFEIVQKGLMAGIPVIATVSAPSSLAIDLARSASMTLLGFVRSDGAGSGRFNVYAGAERIESMALEPSR